MRDADDPASDLPADAAAGQPPSDAQLITRVRGGDRGAFGVLYTRHAAAATTLARQFARSTAEVDDLVSEAFARVLDMLLAGRGPDTAFRAYLFSTVRHTAFDRTRKDAKLQFTDDMTAHETPDMPDDPVVRQLESSLVARAFAALPERWQTVLWHTQVEGESPEQVGLLLGITPTAVTSLAFRAREGLRQAYLQAHLADTAAERCRTTVGRLGSWARGGLAKREKTQVEAHLAECARCRALADELAEMNTSLRALLAPLLLGGAALGYLGAAPAAQAAAAGGTPGASTAAGSTSAGTAASGQAGALAHSAPAAWWSSWPVLAASSAGLVVAVIAGIIVINNGSSAPEDAAPPPAPTAAQHPDPTIAGPSVTSPWVSAASETAPAQTSSPPETTPPASTSTTPAPISTASATTPSSTPDPGAKSSSTAKPTKTSPTAKTTKKKTVTTSASSSALPAALTAPQITSGTISAAAGSAAALSFTVTNSGDADSTVQQLTISAPPGVQVTDARAITGPAGSGLRGAHPARPVPAATDPGLTCSAGGCRYLVPAATTITVTLDLAIAPTARSGMLTVSAEAGSSAIEIMVQPGATALVLGTANTMFYAGGVVEYAPVTAWLAPAVTDMATATFPRIAGALRFTPVDSTCTGTRTTLTCAASQISGGVAYFGGVRVVIAEDGSGPQQLDADIDGWTVPILAASGEPITIARPAGPNG